MIPNTRQAILVNKNVKRIPRGEMWLGHGIFQELGWEDDLKARLRLCHDFAMDILFLPVDYGLPSDHPFNYRRFSLNEISQLITEKHDLAVSIIVDGPFQRLVQKMGLQWLLRKWRTEEAIAALHEESIQISQL